MKTQLLVLIVLSGLILTGCFAKDVVKEEPIVSPAEKTSVEATPGAEDWTSKGSSRGEAREYLTSFPKPEEPIIEMAPMPKPAESVPDRPYDLAQASPAYSSVPSNSGTGYEGSALSKIKVKPANKIAKKVETSLSGYVEGHWLYSVPPEMEVAKKELVEVQLSSSELKAYSTANKKSVVIEKIRVYPLMSVALIGGPAEFSIVNLSTEHQLVSSDITTWKFEVTPLKKGKYSLTFRVTARVKLEDGLVETRDLPIVVKDVTVVKGIIDTLVDWWVSNWQWLITTIVGILIALGWISIKKKKSRVKPVGENNGKGNNILP
jgi:hypothetical protein